MSCQSGLVFLLLVCLSLATQQMGYFLTYEQNGNLKPTKSITEVSDESFIKLLKHNYAVNTEIRSDEEAQIIKQFGKGNFINPIHMNFLYVFETSKNIQSIEDSMLTKAQITPIDLQFTSKAQILDEIYGHSPNSIKSKVTSTFMVNEKTTPFFIFSEDALSSRVFEEHGISIQVVDSKEMMIVDRKTGRVIENVNVEQCVNEFLNPSYQLNLKDGFIYQLNSDKKLQITVSNFKAMQTLLHEVCGLSKFTKIFYKAEIPNMITFYFQSLANVDQNFNDTELPFVYEIWRLAIKKAENNFKKNFDEQELFGEILFVNDPSVLMHMDLTIALKPRILASTTTTTDTSVAQDVTESIVSAFGDAAQIFVWFSLFMILVTYYIVSSMWNMEIQKDSLLYAKFLTSDAQ